MSDLDEAAVKKLKVAELRTELQARGLDSKGNKPVLIERLLEAISKVGEQNGEDVMEESAGPTEPQAEITEDKEETAAEENKEEDVEEEEAKEDETLPEGVEPISEATDNDPENSEQVAVQTEEKPSEKVSLETTEASETAPKEESATQKQENVAQAEEPMETNLDASSTSQTAEG